MPDTPSSAALVRIRNLVKLARGRETTQEGQTCLTIATRMAQALGMTLDEACPPLFPLDWVDLDWCADLRGLLCVVHTVDVQESPHGWTYEGTPADTLRARADFVHFRAEVHQVCTTWTHRGYPACPAERIGGSVFAGLLIGWLDQVEEVQATASDSPLVDSSPPMGTTSSFMTAFHTGDEPHDADVSDPRVEQDPPFDTTAALPLTLQDLLVDAVEEGRRIWADRYPPP